MGGSFGYKITFYEYWSLNRSMTPDQIYKE